MAHLVSFVTAKFDVSKETPNPINPIAGESVLIWLQKQLANAEYGCDLPDTEDWGWYTHAGRGGFQYLIGASADVDGPVQNVEWIIQVHRLRSMKDKFLGRNKLTKDDPLFKCIVDILSADPEIGQIQIDWDA